MTTKRNEDAVNEAQSGARHAVIGDLDEPTKLPETRIDERVLVEERKMAQYSRTAEFKRLKEFLEARIEFFQKYLPDGTAVDALKINNTEMVSYWIAANVIIREFKNVLAEYQQAREAVADATGK